MLNSNPDLSYIYSRNGRKYVLFPTVKMKETLGLVKNDTNHNTYITVSYAAHQAVKQGLPFNFSLIPIDIVYVKNYYKILALRQTSHFQFKKILVYSDGHSYFEDAAQAQNSNQIKQYVLNSDQNIIHQSGKISYPEFLSKEIKNSIYQKFAVPIIGNNLQMLGLTPNLDVWKNDLNLMREVFRSHRSLSKACFNLNNLANNKLFKFAANGGPDVIKNISRFSSLFGSDHHFLKSFVASAPNLDLINYLGLTGLVNNKNILKKFLKLGLDLSLFDGSDLAPKCHNIIINLDLILENSQVQSKIIKNIAIWSSEKINNYLNKQYNHHILNSPIQSPNVNIDLEDWELHIPKNRAEIINIGSVQRHCIASLKPEELIYQRKAYLFSFYKKGSTLSRGVTVLHQIESNSSEVKGFANRNPTEPEMNIVNLIIKNMSW